MKCCPHCEHLNELTQIQCEICSKRLTQAIVAKKKRCLSSAGTGKKLKCQDEGMTLISVIALIVTTILISLGGVKGNQIWNDGQESKINLSGRLENRELNYLRGAISLNEAKALQLTKEKIVT